MIKPRYPVARRERSGLPAGVQPARLLRSVAEATRGVGRRLGVFAIQNFATESFATISSEGAQVSTRLDAGKQTGANQYLAQIDEATADAVFGNVGSLLAFQVGCRDAEVLAEQFGGDLTPGDLMCLPRYMAYCRLLVDGMPSKPFSMQTLPPIGRSREDRTAIVRKVSRRRYARPLSQVNSQLERQLAVGD